MTDFAAIDFETANECPSSVCSVGIVVVRDGEITDRFYSLIHPEPEYYQWFCMRVHGLCAEDTENAPVFPYVWEKIEPLIEGLPLVAHNARFDEGCLRAVFRVYQMDYPEYEFWIIRNMSFTTPCGPPGGISAIVFQTISSRLSRPPAGTTSRTTIMPLPMRKPAPQ